MARRQLSAYWGFKKVGNIIKAGGKGSTYVKGVGVAAVIGGAAFVQPEIVAGGVSLYNAGGRMEDISTAIELGSNVMNKDGSSFLINAAATLLGNVSSKVVGKAIDGTSKVTKAQKFIGKAVSDKVIGDTNN